MENEFYNGEFEQLIKEKADQFSMYPSRRVWHSIYNNLHPSRRWPSIVMSLLLMGSLSLIGYLNTSDNSIDHRSNDLNISNIPATNSSKETDRNNKQNYSYPKTRVQPVTAYNHAFDDIITNGTDFYNYTVVKSNRPKYLFGTTQSAESKQPAEGVAAGINGKELVQAVDAYIKSNKIFTDIAINNKKIRNSDAKPAVNDADPENNTNTSLINTGTDKTVSTQTGVNHNAVADLNKLNDADKKALVKVNAVTDKKSLTNEEKDWIENYVSLDKSAKNKWKDRMAFQFYATPAVNYRKLTTRSKGSTSAFATADINSVISQKPGFGMEAGADLTYAFAKRLQFKAGLQFNYTNYNIDADQTNHPIITTILLNDPSTGYSYSAARTSTTSNVYNTAALQPVTLHNRTYQVSVPVGFAYKLSSEKNVDWFAGATVQPTYVFGGNAHLISSDLKSYVSDPSSIRTWNLNLGFETYMNFKLGTYSLQVGPQVRYQVYSTYRKDVALIEKPYAVGLKFGLTKGF